VTLAEQLAPDLLERFLRYVRVDTQSARDRTGSPSTPGQLELARMLLGELNAIGLGDAAVEPIVHRGYDGGAIELPRNGTVLDPADMPVLAGKRGHDIVTSSGDTLLGADDKAGVAAIMAAVAHLAAHPDAPRPTLRIGFTPDEEVGEGATLFDIERFGALCAYTIDGSQPGELQDETFSASEIVLTVHGVDLHPALATGKLVNAARLGARIVAALPSDRLTPETTAGREGFVHVYETQATAGVAVIRAIVRDFDDDLLEQHVALVRRTAEEVVATEPRARLEVAVRHQYPNMRRFVEPYPEIVAAAERALREEGLEPVRTPIRGGTDGSMLSARGLPTPNLSAWNTGPEGQVPLRVFAQRAKPAAE
jgi:tripeptide aminopeptidase